MKVLLSKDCKIENINLFADKVIFQLPFGKIVYVLEGGFVKLMGSTYKIKDKGSLVRFVNIVTDKFVYGLKGFYIELDLVGLGYNFGLYSNTNILRFEGGFSHRIFLSLGKKIAVFTEKKRLILFGISRKTVMNVFSDLKHLKKFDVYKGKGIRLKNEVIKLKVGKKR